jgi:glutamate synthase domain-containing protein 3
MGVRNVNRCVGGVLSSRIAQRHGADGLPADTLEIDFTGSAGQSFGGWLAPGVSFTLHGDANDYTGKGLSGGVLAVLPRDGVTFAAEDQVVVGNTVLYGATEGRAFFRGRAGERFAVRNSGANAVVEGVGDHGCEYMTGGRVVVLGATGRNFAAGMSGGLAFVLDEDGAFRRRINPVMLEQIEPLDEGDAIEVRDLVDEHVRRTGSPVGRRVLDEWDALLPKFVKVFPTDYKRVLAELAESEALTAGEATAARNDHPHSTGGEGFVTTEGELDEPLVPAPDSGASGDAAREARVVRPEPSAEGRADG